MTPHVDRAVLLKAVQLLLTILIAFLPEISSGFRWADRRDALKGKIPSLDAYVLSGPFAVQGESKWALLPPNPSIYAQFVNFEIDDTISSRQLSGETLTLTPFYT